MGSVELEKYVKLYRTTRSMTVLATQAVTMAELKFVITTQLELGRNFVKMDIVFDASILGVTALKGIFVVIEKVVSMENVKRLPRKLR